MPKAAEVSSTATPARRSNNMTTLTAKALKVSAALNPAELAALRVPDGQPRVVLEIAVGGRVVSADVAAKALRKAQATIREVGAEGCVTLIQGRFEPGDAISEAGLIVQARTPKEATDVSQGVRQGIPAPDDRSAEETRADSQRK
jgi:hypothetical protein